MPSIDVGSRFGRDGPVEKHRFGCARHETLSEPTNVAAAFGPLAPFGDEGSAAFGPLAPFGDEADPLASNR